MASKLAVEPVALTDLAKGLQRVDRFADVLAALQRGESGAVDGAWGSACALVAAALMGPCSGKLIVVLPRTGDLDEFSDDLSSFSGHPPLIFPAWESPFQEQNVSDVVWGARLRVLKALANPKAPKVVVTSIQALLQPVPSQRELAERTRPLRVGDELDLDAFLGWLVDHGFERVTGIERPGEFSLHGGILDLFPPDAADPLRIEFFGDEIESIRVFDVETQRTVQTLERAELTLVAPPVPLSRLGDAAGRPDGDGGPPGASGSQPAPGGHFLDSLPRGSWIILTEPFELREEGRQYLSRLDDSRGFFSVAATLERCTKWPTVTVAGINADSFETACHLPIEAVDRMTGPRSEVLHELAACVDCDERVLLACHNEAERQRLSELLKETDPAFAERVTLCLGHVSRGFRIVAERLVVL
ncbi:MAG: transcription-repair coupling factor, partial [Planctomycetes bacterium]|nr:transcription-repair coupling factor [Planctomycetota bacterium]